MSSTDLFRRIDRNVLLPAIAIIVIVILALSFGLLNNSGQEDPIKIGVVDSGCSENQSSFVEEFTTFTYVEYGYPVNETTVYDTVGHGSNVCQIIDDNSETNHRIYSAKIANNEGTVTYAGVIGAVTYLVEEHEVDIINLSLGGDIFTDEELEEAFKEYADSTLLVAAIGNKGAIQESSRGLIDWPAELPWVIAVGAGTSDGIETYSSTGRNSEGIDVIEFYANGATATLTGTSFSAPRVTSRLANYLQIVRSEVPDINPGEFMYLFLKNGGYTQYSGEFGWGQIKDVDQIDLNEGILVASANEIDPSIRFTQENWSVSWKYFAYGLENIEFSTTGNGTDQIQNLRIENYEWGGIITLDLQGGDVGNYTVSVNHNDMNEVVYNFHIRGNFSKKVLFDHQFTKNGYAHAFGDFEFIDDYLRSMNVITVHSMSGEEDLSEFDTIIITEFGRSELVSDRIFESSVDELDLERYTSFLEGGGDVLLHLPPKDTFKQMGFNDLIESFNITSTDYQIPSNSNSPAFVNDIIDNPITFEVDLLPMSGVGINSTSDSNQILAYYSHASSNGVVTTVVDVPVIIKNEELGGRLIVFASSTMIGDVYFENTGNDYQQLLVNILA